MKYLRNAKPRPTKKVRSEAEDMSGTEEESQAKKPRKEFKQFPKSPAAPLIPAGEDKASHLRHLKMLQHEERKVSPNKQLISDLMRRTYPFRRQEILEQPQPIQQLLQTYPSLKRSEQILAELDRILENEDAVKQLRETWMNTIPKIFEIAENEANYYTEALLEDVKSDPSDASRSVLATTMVAYLLPDTRMIADPSRVVIFLSEFTDATAEAKKVSHLQPVVLIRGTTTDPKDDFLVCEKQVLSKFSVADLPIVLFATYYVFNMQYCSGCTNLFSFLEVLFINATPPKRTKLNHFLNMLEHTSV